MQLNVVETGMLYMEMQLVWIMILYPMTMLIEYILVGFCFVCRLFCCMHVCGGLRSTSDVNLRTSPPCVFETDLSLGTRASITSCAGLTGLC